MNKLKSCPFCGGEAEIITAEPTWLGPSLILVKCKNGPCSCQTPTLVNSDTENSAVANARVWDKEKALVDIWNRRVSDE